MLAHYISRVELFYAALRVLLAAATLLGLWRLWRRPRPLVALALILATHLVAAAATFLPLHRPYALGESTDRAFNLGMAARVALGGSPLEHTQVGFESPEPLMNVVVATLAGFDVDRVAVASALLTPLSILCVGFGCFFGLRPARDDDKDAWERVTIAFAVLSLTSLSMSPRPPTPPFWAGNFLLKPNHGAALGLVALAAGFLARRRALALALVLGASAWVFLLDWAYALPGLLLGVLLIGRAERPWRALGVGVGASALAALPYVLHLLPGYSPAKSHAAARHMWGDPRGLPLAVPNWSTLDLGLLLVLGVIGASVLWRRSQPRDRLLLGLVLGAAACVLVSMPLALVGVAPEPDELHYYLRFAAGLAAGTALAAAASQLESLRGLAPGQGSLLVLAVLTPLSLPIYWDPPNTDRYFDMSREPIPPKVLAYARFVKERLPRDAVFAAGADAASWIPALTGRRVLLAEGGKLLPPDLAERKRVERTLLLSDDAAAIRSAAVSYGVTHVAVDEALCAAYGVSGFDQLATGPGLKTVFANSAARLVAIEPP